MTMQASLTGQEAIRDISALAWQTVTQSKPDTWEATYSGDAIVLDEKYGCHTIGAYLNTDGNINIFATHAAHRWEFGVPPNRAVARAAALIHQVTAREDADADVQ